MSPLVRVVTSSESAARDTSAIAAGVPSRALMQRAGAAAAAEIALRRRENLDAGVLVLVGPGNNGGDAWVVARALATTGVRVRVIEPIPAKTPDAIAERTMAIEVLGPDAVTTGRVPEDFDHGEGLIVDGLLGTGAVRAPAGDLAKSIDQAKRMRARGAAVVALDVPSALDATSGQALGSIVCADLTLTFGTLKRGHTLDRGACGHIVVLDIGLGRHSLLDDHAPELVDDRWADHHEPPISASAHKGDRKKLAIVGGARGMAGAPVLAARAAMRSGIGMVKLIVDAESVATVQELEPYALAGPWPGSDDEVDRSIAQWADAVVIGPGLGRTDESRALVERTLRCWRGPTLLDADALTVFAGDASSLAALLGGRPALITPHPAEFARLAGVAIGEVVSQHFDIGLAMAATLGAAVLLKGVPTVISSPRGERLVSASGTPALAAAGSGDVLSGIAGTMLAQIDDPGVAGALAAFVHGRAAERVPSTGAPGARGISLDDVINELRDSWRFDGRPLRYPVLVELPNPAGRQ